MFCLGNIHRLCSLLHIYIYLLILQIELESLKIVPFIIMLKSGHHNQMTHFTIDLIVGLSLSSARA